MFLSLPSGLRADDIEATGKIPLFPDSGRIEVTQSTGEDDSSPVCSILKDGSIARVQVTGEPEPVWVLEGVAARKLPSGWIAEPIGGAHPSQNPLLRPPYDMSAYEWVAAENEIQPEEEDEEVRQFQILMERPTENLQETILLPPDLQDDSPPAESTSEVEAVDVPRIRVVASVDAATGHLQQVNDGERRRQFTFEETEEIPAPPQEAIDVVEDFLGRPLHAIEALPESSES